MHGNDAEHIVACQAVLRAGARASRLTRWRQSASHQPIGADTSAVLYPVCCGTQTRAEFRRAGMNAPLCGVVYCVPLAFSVVVQVAAQQDPTILMDPTLGTVRAVLCPMLCTAGVVMRQKFRSEKGIDGNFCEDFLCVFDHNLRATSTVGGC